MIMELGYVIKKSNCITISFLFVSIFAIVIYFYVWHSSYVTPVILRKLDLISVNSKIVVNRSSKDNNALLGSSSTCTQKARLDHIQRLCKLYKSQRNFPTEQRYRFITDRKNQVAFCEIPKAACSTWKGVMANISSQGIVGPLDKDKFQQLHFYSYLSRLNLTHEGVNAILGIKSKFLVVRHPLERLVSAYKDKMLGSQPLFVGFADKITNRYRSKSEKVQCQEGNYSTCSKRPTFPEFVKMVVDSNNSLSHEPHWESYIQLCNPCVLNYDYILKVETLEQDMDMFIREAYGTEMLKYVKQKHVNKKTQKKTEQNNHSTSKITFGKYLKEFESLTEELVDKLLDKFKFDLELFGYSFDKDKITGSCGYEGVSNQCC